MTSMNSISDNISLSQQSPSIPYVPDFTVRALTDLQYIRIRRAHYVAALRASLLERRHRQHGAQDSNGVGGVTITGGLSSVQANDEEDTFNKEWQRAQTALAASPIDGTKSDTASITDDVSVRDVSASFQPCYDGADSSGLQTESTVASDTFPEYQRTDGFRFSSPLSESNELPLLQTLKNK